VPRRYRLGVVAVLSLAVTAVVVTVAVRAATSDGGTGAAHRSAGPGASASPSGGTPVEPGRFGRPSISSSDPYDAFHGARPIPGIDVAAARQELTTAWGLEFTSRALLGGVMWSGLGGDKSRKQRRLDAIIETNNSGSAVFQVMCQAGGTEVTPNDDTSLRFVPDCLAKAVHGPDLADLRTWLDEHLRTMAENGGSTWYQLPSLRMYVESDRHVVSCVLTNSR
jgi:hypothetical protein